MVSLHRRLLDRAVHPLDLAAPQESSPPHCFLFLAAPWMAGFGQPVLNLIGLADHVETHSPRIRGVTIAGLFGELDAIIGQDRMDAIGDGLEQQFEAPQAVLRPYEALFAKSVPLALLTSPAQKCCEMPRKSVSGKLQRGDGQPGE
ncbi:hypothetical protein J4E08_22755 [Sagittula sp. NFXS13]